MAPARRFSGFVMPGFYTNRSKSYSFDSDYIQFTSFKSLSIGNEIYFFGYDYENPINNSFFTTDINGNRLVGPKVAGRPRGIVSDGYNGFFIYGNFQYVNGKYREGIAHFNSLGYLTEWNAGLNGPVWSVITKNLNVYVGGEFTSSKEVVRNRLAAFSLSGQLLTWNPNANANVHSLELKDNDIYIGGAFTVINGNTRSRLAVVNTSGNVLAWNPSADNTVYDIRIPPAATGTMYICGDFTLIDGNTRNRLASIDAVTTTSYTIQPWNPNANGRVQSIEGIGANIYIGGTFTSVGGTARNNLAALDSSGTVLAWNPNANNRVFKLFSDGLNLYAQGFFTQIGTVRRSSFAVINTNGNLQDYYINSYADLTGTYASGFLQKFGNNVYSYREYYPKDRTFGIYKKNNYEDVVKFLNVNRDINDAVAVGSNVYIGGSFTRVGGSWSSLSIFSTAGSDITDLFITSNNSDYSNVCSIVPFGIDEFYIVGIFDDINGQTRTSIAHKNSTGFISTFDVGIIGEVRALAISGNNIYLGGNFISVGGESRINLAAINTAGKVLSWNPSTDAVVYSLFINGSNVYIGGSFTTVNGTTRNRLAAINTIDINATGNLLAWNPNASNTVYVMTPVSNDIYIGGIFTSVTATVRNRIALVNTSGSLLSWNPSASGGVYDIKVSGNNVYVGGNFTTILSNARNYLAALSTAAINATGNVLTWNPSADSYVETLDISGSNIYVGGNFTLIGGNSRTYVAAINTLGNILTWNPFIGGSVWSLPEFVKVIGTNVYYGWYYPELFGPSAVARSRLAAVNTSGSVLTWNPSADNIVRSLAVSGNDIYVAGTFTSINGNTRNRLAAVNTLGNVLTWNPSADNIVNSIAILGSNIYVGGRFSLVNGNTRSRLASVNTTGNVLPWNPSANANVEILVINENVIYVAGLFTGLGTNTSFRTITEAGVENIITAVVAGSVRAIAPDASGGVYIGGDFTSVDGVDRSGLAYINSSGIVTSWNPSASALVDALVLAGNEIYIGGEFTSISATVRNRLAAVNTAGSLLSWNPSADGAVREMAISGTGIYIGGAFTLVNGNARSRLAAVSTINVNATGNVLAWNPSANANVRAVAVSGVNIYVGGDFTLVTGNTRNRAAAINTSTTLSILAWHPNVNGNVHALAVIGNDIYLGGAFTTSSLTARRYLMAMNVSGSLITWNPSADAAVDSLAVLGTNIYVGGAFTLINGNTRNDLAAVNTSGNILAWNPSSSATICALATSGTNVYIGASAVGTTATGKDSKFFAAINASGSMATLPKTSLKRTPKAVAVSGDNIYLGGADISTSLNTLVDTANYLYSTNDEGKILKRYSLTKGVTNSGPGIYDFAVDASGGVYIGGEFGSVDGITANNIAYINSSGGVVSWGVGTNNVVHDIAILGDNVYIGGWFTAVNGVERQRLAAASSINVNATGNLLAWNPSASSNVYDIDIANNIIYVGGSFTSVNGNVRNYLAAINTSGGVLSWNPNANGLIADLKIVGSNVYIGGEFTTIGLTTRNYLAALNIVDINATGNLLTWNPSANAPSYAMAVSGTNIYVGGFFTLIGGNARTNFAVVNTAGNIQSLNVEILFNINTIPEWYTPTATISCIDVDGSNIYVSGLSMQTAGGQLRPGAFAVNTSGSILSFSAIGNWISRIKKVGSRIFVAPTVIGFTPVNGGESVISNFITLNKTNLLLKSINIDTDFTIYDINIGSETLKVNSGRQVFDIVPSYKITDERCLNSIEQGLE